ncbi:MAG: hypothetical protein WKF75_00760 [Singulisphaera sp.]
MSRPHPRPSLRWGPAAALASLFLAGAATPALAGGHHHRGKTERMILVPAPRVVVISAAPTRTTVRVIEREVYRVASTPAAPAPAPMPAGRDLEMERSLEGLAKSMPAPASYGERDFASSQAMESSLQGTSTAARPPLRRSSSGCISARRPRSSSGCISERPPLPAPSSSIAPRSTVCSTTRTDRGRGLRSSAEVGRPE